MTHDNLQAEAWDVWHAIRVRGERLMLSPRLLAIGKVGIASNDPEPDVCETCGAKLTAARLDGSAVVCGHCGHRYRIERAGPIDDEELELLGAPRRGRKRASRRRNMPKKPISLAQDMTDDDAKRAMERLQHLLYADVGELPPGAPEGPLWDPDKEWDSDTLGEVGTIMDEAGLTPTRLMRRVGGARHVGAQKRARRTRAKAAITLAQDMTGGDAKRAMGRLQHLLYADVGALRSGAKEGPLWDPEKEWDSDTLGEIGTIVNEAGLTPTRLMRRGPTKRAASRRGQKSEHVLWVIRVNGVTQALKVSASPDAAEKDVIRRWRSASGSSANIREVTAQPASAARKRPTSKR